MAKNQELELSILIGGHVDNSLAQAVKSANSQIGSIANGASKFAADIAKGAAVAAGSVAAGVVNATKEAVSFESEMLDVTKYVGGLTDDNGKIVHENYAQMSKDILDLSTEIPYTEKELTRLAAAAGQSGKNMDDLISEGFLRDVAEMGTAMDISADQAGDWAAKWEVAFGTNHEGVMKLADQINYLGAHYATTAAEIAQTVNDTGSLGLIAGMDTDQTAALSTALLAMGVNSSTVATSIRRMYTNLTMGSKATKAQKEAFEELGFSATQFAKDMQKVDANGKSLAPEALKKLFTAIGQQDEDKQVGYLKTLLGQWAIESGAKLTGNLDLFVQTLDDVGDASKYNGSMYKEFLLKCETSESVLTMMNNAWRAVRIEIGNNFLPILKEVAGVGIDKLNDFRAALPDITAKVKEVIEYLLNNGDKVIASIGGIGAAWAGLRFAPQILQVVSGATKGVNGVATGGGKIFNGIKTIASGMSYGAQMAGIQSPSVGPQPQNSTMRSIAAKANGAGVGLWATLRNFKGLTKNDGKTKIDFVRDVLSASDRGVTIRESFPKLNRIAVAASELGNTQLVTGAKNLWGRAKTMSEGLPKNPIRSIVGGVGSTAKEMLTGIVGPNGMDLGGAWNGIKQFGGAAKDVIATDLGKTPLATGVRNLWSKAKGTSADLMGNTLQFAVKGLAGANFANGTELGRTIWRMSNGNQTGREALGSMKYILGQKTKGQMFGDVAQWAAGTPVGKAVGGVGKFVGGVGSTTKQVLTGIAGKNGLDLGGAWNGIKQFGGAAKDVVGGGIKTFGTKYVAPVAEFGGKALDLGKAVASPILKGGFNIFGGLMSTFGPVIAGLGGVIAVVSLLGDHFTDIQYIVYELFGNKGLELFNQFAVKVKDIGGTIKDSITNAFSLENLQNIQQSLSGKSVLGIDDLGTTFGAVIPIIESVKGLIGQIVDLGVNRIKPLLADVMDFAVNELFPAVSPLISMVISLVGTTLTNAIKVVIDVIHGLLPVVEPVIMGIVSLIKGIVSVTIKVVNTIIRALNKFSVTVPDWVPEIGGKKFGFDLKEVALPAFANGGFTNGVSIAGEAGTEAVISFKPSVRDSNVENWVRAGRMLGVSGEDATRAAGVQNIQYFANGGFTDGSREKLDNLIDFSKAYGEYALRSNGINSTGDVLSMMWTVANNSMSGDGSLALAATSIAADVAPLVLNKYLGGDSVITNVLTEAAKTYNGGTVLSSWDKDTGVLTDTGTPLYMLPQTNTERTLPDLPPAAYRNSGSDSENSGNIRDSQFVFAPQITVGSNAQAAEMEQMMREMFEQFKREMREEAREQERVKYAS